jgi:hypothetical protein
MNQEFLSLKWGTVKEWNFYSEECFSLWQKYLSLGSSHSAIHQEDTPEQKGLICQIIDACNAEKIWLDWDGVEVSKEDAKRYVMEYGVSA